MAVDHDLLDLAEQAALEEELEVLAAQPRKEAQQSRARGYPWFSGIGATGMS